MLWRRDHPDTPYGESFSAMTPTRHFEQKFGLVISTAVSSHLLRANNKIRSKPPVQCLVSELCHCDDKVDLDTEFDETHFPFCGECTDSSVHPPAAPAAGLRSPIGRPLIS